MRAQSIKVSDTMPGIKLKDQHNNEINISDIKGKRVLLSFHPLAWTRICAQQMQALEKNRKRFMKVDTVAFGISVDSVPSKHAWAKKLKIKDTSLLSDFWPHGEIARKLGIFRKKEGFAQRANIIVNEEKKVTWVKVYNISDLPDIEEIIGVLEKEK